MGLPYAQDAGITRHIAAFLSKQANALSGGEETAQQDFNPFANMPGMPGAEAPAADFIKPTAILFNGGVLKSSLLADRLEDTINEWLINADAEFAKQPNWSGSRSCGCKRCFLLRLCSSWSRRSYSRWYRFCLLRRY